MTETPSIHTDANGTPTPPIAKKEPVERTHHGDTFVDPYEWLRDKESSEVLNHLKAENAYTEAITADQASLREAIFNEIKHRTVETDLSVPARRGDYWWFMRTIEGQQHPVFCRVAASNSAADGPSPSSDLSAWTPPQIEPGVALEGEELYFDTNAEAAAHSFYDIGGMSTDDAGTLLAYAEDTTGDEHYTLRFRNLRTGENLPETVENVHGGALLDSAGERAFYMVADASWRPYRLYEHRLGTSAEQDQLLIEITDDQLWSFPYLSADKRELLLFSGNSEYNETRILDLSADDAQMVLLVGKEHRLEHNIEPIELDGVRHLLITHNQQGQNKSLSLTTVENLTAQSGAASASGSGSGGSGEGTSPPSTSAAGTTGEPTLDLGQTVLTPEDTVKLDDSVVVTAAQVLVQARVNTIQSVYLLPLDVVRAVRDGGEPISPRSLSGPQFDEEMFTAELSEAEYEAPVFRVRFTSWLIPARVYDIAHTDPTPVLRRETPLNDVDLGNYQAQRLWAGTGDTWADGTEVQVPVTVLHHKDVHPDGNNPTLVYGYGSYEITMDPALAVPVLSLLDRGIVFAVAHVRGGGELGRPWYDDGKKLEKVNTFTDFITVTDYLVETGWADQARIAAHGGSAGGLLMGAVANMTPEKYVAIVAQVPFVDNLTSILDPDLPLSALEWEEWGNPIEDPEVYEYMKSYSPYENLHDAEYPAIAAVTSLHDTRVLYVEPAKWVPALREHQQSLAPIVLKIEMEGGHGGASGRYEKWKDRAWDYAFVAHYLGAAELR